MKANEMQFLLKHHMPRFKIGQHQSQSHQS